MEQLDLSEWISFPTLVTDTVVDHVSIDSRYIASPHSLFIALRGKKGDGHQYVRQALASGAKFALVETSWQAPEGVPEDKLIRVQSTLQSLQDLAAYYRRKCSPYVIAIAGSCGKTMLKDLLGHLLGEEIYVSPESFNNQLGVALSLLHMPANCRFACIEVAATEKEEMKRLCRMIQPNSALVTNFYRKRFGTGPAGRVVAEEIIELLKAIPQEGFAIIEQDDRIDLRKVLCHVHFWNQPHETLPDVIPEGTVGGSLRRLSCRFPDGTVDTCSVSEHRAYIVELISLALKAAWKLGVPSKNLLHKLHAYEPQTMRTEIWKNKSDITFVNSTYSHTLLSLNASLDELTAYSHLTGKRHLMFGGLQDEKIPPKALIDAFSSHSIQHVFCWPKSLGNLLQTHASSVCVHACETAEEALGMAQQVIQPHDIVIFKGPKKLSYEWLFEQIEGSVPNTVACINLAAIKSNIEMIRAKLPPRTRIMVMVKALAYGTDDVQIAHFLNSCGIDILGVSYVDEGVSMRKMGVKQAVFALHASAHEMQKAVKWGLEIGVSSQEEIKAAERAAGDTPFKLHLHVDTGMKRLGCRPDEAVSLGKMIAASPKLVFEGLMTHFPAADNIEQDAFTLNQVNILTDILDQFTSMGLRPSFCHACNSVAAIRFSFDQFNMIRLGLATYGIHTSSASAPILPLRPALSLMSKIAGFNKASAGETVSYGRTYVVTEPEARLAVVPVGYFDGLHRAYSGKGYVIIRGQKAPMVGRICMDYMMVDVTHIPEASLGDSVLLFGEDEGGEYLSPETLATRGGSIVHELMTCIGPRVQRLFIYDESLLIR
jgi:alanine racemase/UDP-N-acetylmuramoyl-tripeptide--D-alanyl-D-alanine ligase